MSPLRRLDVAIWRLDVATSEARCRHPSTADFLGLGDVNEVAPVNIPIGNFTYCCEVVQGATQHFPEVLKGGSLAAGQFPQLRHAVGVGGGVAGVIGL